MIAGVVLAAGQGRRFGAPKAFERTEGGETWADRAIESLLATGCAPVIVTLPELRDLTFPDAVTPLVVVDGGQSESLRAALAAVPVEATAVMITLVDLPDVDARVVRRLVEAVPHTPEVLARAGYHGSAGHPVLIGRTHFDAILQTLSGDRGARDYLVANSAELVECGDLASGIDVDKRYGGA
ncbi:MAG: nucleotidyltransferase family protein [Marmoricola sp.]